MIADAADRLLAVLIDGDNFPAGLAPALFAAIGELGEVAVSRVYGTTAGIAGWREAATKYRIGLHEAMPGKNATDMKLAIDAMDIHYRGRVGDFCIVSSDSDFAELARRLREDGVCVHGFGESKAAVGFRGACNSFAALDSPAQSETNAHPPAVTQRSTPSVDAAWTKLLNKALKQLPAGASEVPVSELNQRVMKLDKSFSSRKYGSTSFKKLLKDSGLEISKAKGRSLAVLR